jgi:ferric-dicitrate binding protein FerR (iron transport regulator)
MLARQLEEAWENSAVQMEAAGTERVLQAVRAKLPARQVRVSGSVKQLWIKRLSAAAAMLAVVCAAAWFWKYTTQRAESSTASWYTVANTRQHKMYCRLPDSSEVWLSPHTVIRYRATSAGREAEMEGEAFFTITKDAAHPFIVQAGGVHTLVLGTRFNIEAWPQESYTHIALTEGSIRTRFANAMGGADSLLVNPGSAVVYNRSSHQAIPQKITTGTEDDWTHNRIVLHDLSLEAALQRVAGFYGKKLSVSSRLKGSQLFSAVLPGNNLPAALDNISFVYRLSYTLTGDTITVTGK